MHTPGHNDCGPGRCVTKERNQASWNAEFRTVTALRGLASLAVCLFHLGNIQSVGWTGQGFLGVQCFFVISGFVIPYSLHRAKYRESEFWRYLARRAVRIDPPYLASIVLAIATGLLVAATPWYRGQEVHFTLPQVAAHLGYVNNFLGFKPISPVYWTLGIEFQYYILVGLFCGALLRANRLLVFAIAGASIALNHWLPASFDHRYLILQWMTIFLAGITVASFRCGLMSRMEAVIRVVALCATAAFIVPKPAMALVAFGTALLILFTDWSSRPLDWLGRMSYSLYLIHVPLGERLMAIGARLVSSPVAVSLWLLMSLALTLVAAALFALVIEAPAIRWARRISYHREPADLRR